MFNFLILEYDLISRIFPQINVGTQLLEVKGRDSVKYFCIPPRIHLASAVIAKCFLKEETFGPLYCKSVAFNMPKINSGACSL